MMLVDMGSWLQLIVVAMHLKDNFEKSQTTGYQHTQDINMLYNASMYIVALYSQSVNLGAQEAGNVYICA